MFTFIWRRFEIARTDRHYTIEMIALAAARVAAENKYKINLLKL